ncbi:MAG: hypothetical protein ACOYLC_03160 [Armatimonadaceae bacterium]|jgi:hypothetical protein
MTLNSESGNPDRPVAVTTAIIGFVIVNILLGYRLGWAVWPFVTGVVLAESLWVGNSIIIRKYLSPQKITESNAQKRALSVFALVKYPLVAVCIWTCVRLGDTRQLMSFVAGYLLLQIVVVVRMVGKSATQIR